LGYRLNEFAEAIDVSRATLNRWIKNGKVKVAYINDTPIIPVAEKERLLTPL
jgi:predicted site-specific integrase-resolvase